MIYRSSFSALGAFIWAIKYPYRIYFIIMITMMAKVHSIGAPESHQKISKWCIGDTSYWLFWLTNAHNRYSVKNTAYMHTLQYIHCFTVSLTGVPEYCYNIYTSNICTLFNQTLWSGKSATDLFCNILILFTLLATEEPQTQKP